MDISKYNSIHKMASKTIILSAFAVLGFASSCSKNPKESITPLPPITGTPLVWGFDDAGMELNEHLTKKAINDFGFDLVVHHCQPSTSGNEFALKSMSNFYAENKVQWILNLEIANWTQSFVDANGTDWYNQPDGRHFFMFPENVLTALSGLAHKPGIMYDEAEHMQNARNSTTIEGFEKPFFLKDEDAVSLDVASDNFTRQTKIIADKYKSHGLQVYSEHVFPIQFHTFAAAGFIPVSKILKENCIPAYIACSMGAAIQYKTPFWLTPDLWFVNDYPGHSEDQYRSALLMAYHMGAEGIYTENIAYEGTSKQGSLVLMNAARNDYQLTELGKVAKWFRWDYAPRNPRNYKFSELIPRVAIIRKEDACWGQSQSWLPDQLFGIKAWKSNAVTEAWLQIWNLLSNGEINSHSINWHNSNIFGTPYKVFFPLDGVVVFDEKASGENLAKVELIFLTGLGISPATLDAVSSRVKQGAVCVSLPALVPKDIRTAAGNNGMVTDGSGKWVVTESFLTDQVKQNVQPFLPKENYIRYRFGDTEVQFRPANNNSNQVSVSIN
jgi:hypothetical protein